MRKPIIIIYLFTIIFQNDLTGQQFNFILNDFYTGKFDEVKSKIKFSTQDIEGILPFLEEVYHRYELQPITIKNSYEFINSYFCFELEENIVNIKVVNENGEDLLFIDENVLFDLLSPWKIIRPEYGALLIKTNKNLGEKWLFKCAKKHSYRAYEILMNYSFKSDENHKKVSDLFALIAKTNEDELVWTFREIIYVYVGKREEWVKILKKETKEGSEQALMKLAEIYTPFSKYQPPKGYVKGIHVTYYKLAVGKFKNKDAMYRLGQLYATDFGDVKMNLDSAVYWLEQATKHRNNHAPLFLCEYYGQGKDGWKKNKIKYVKYLRITEEIANKDASIADSLGDFFADSSYETYDSAKALFYYDLAIKKGSNDSYKIEEKIDTLMKGRSNRK